MSDKYRKVTPKVHPLTYAGIFGFILVTIGLIFLFMPTEKEKIYNSYANLEGINLEYFTEDHPFNQVKYKSSLFNKGLKDIIEDQELVILYIGTPNCSACVSSIGAFAYYFDAKDRGYDMSDYFSQIYYLNSASETKGFQELYENHLAITSGTPQLVVFQNGEVIKTYSFTSELGSINNNVLNFYRTLDTQLKSE